MAPKITPTERLLLTTAALISLGYILRSEKFLFFAMLVTSVLAVAWLWQKYALHGLEYRRTFSEHRAFVGEVVEVTFSVTNRKPLPLPHLRIDDYFSEDLIFTDLKPETSHIPGLSIFKQYFSLSWFERTGRTYHLDCRQRGLYTFPQLRIQTGDPFGLFTVQRELIQEDRLIIYPEVKPVAGLDFPAKELLGAKVADRRLFEDPIYMRGIRPYQPEDDLRHVHWKATARTDVMQTKMFEPTTAPNVVLFVNIATLSRLWQGVDPELLERVVSVAASLCAYAVENRLMIGLAANGTAFRSDQPLRVLPSRSPQQLTRLLEALAGIRGYAGSEFETFLLHESSRLPWGSTILIITAVVTPELEVVMLRLKDAGRKLVLLSMAEAPPRWLRGVLTYHLPGRTVEEAYHFIPAEIPAAEDDFSAEKTEVAR